MLAKECMKMNRKLSRMTMRKDAWQQTCISFARECNVPRIEIEREFTYKINRIQFIKNGALGNTPPPNKIRRLIHENKEEYYEYEIMNSEEDGFSEGQNLPPEIYQRRSQRLEEKNMKRKNKKAYEYTLFDGDDDDER